MLQVQRKQREISGLQTKLAENEDRVHAMCSHLKNVRQELQHTQVCLLCTEIWIWEVTALGFFYIVYPLTFQV